MFLFDFQILRPFFETPQQDALDWVVKAHTKASQGKESSEVIAQRLSRVGCSAAQITKRGHVLKDFTHEIFEEMQIFNLEKFPHGAPLSTRMKIYDEEVGRIFEKYYEDKEPIDDLIHVSCTGYTAPSGAQRLVSNKGWGDKTTVTHAYHMGCYGAIPALRIATGFLKNGSRGVDLVHTEICTPHFNPSKGQADQLVSQSLFADGFIKYSLTSQTDVPSLKIKAIREEIIPNSLKAMSWNLGEWGFEMTLAKEIPVFIRRFLPSFLTRFKIPKNALFAIHPGGPKILHYIQEELSLKDEQIAYSFKILKEYGNMSSATLPHVWEMILNDPKIPSKTPIVSLAFGPGLTVAAILMEKVCGI